MFETNVCYVNVPSRKMSQASVITKEMLLCGRKIACPICRSGSGREQKTKRLRAVCRDISLVISARTITSHDITRPTANAANAILNPG